ncbi:hypothetical protein [Actinomadura madurae]|uniref:hypothetical protein n=1 Tax=Actinomadura madurae TaxID=1993 RepID=UPI0020D21187|nr:hypothetical protein [Actinomadura madurae]MCQ0018016.1 hypothetical protein [Actinomadura madurae]
MLAYAASGVEPFADDGMAAVLRRVKEARADLAGIADPWLRDLIGDCLRLEPERRPTAAGLLARLDGAGRRTAPAGCPRASPRPSTAGRPAPGGCPRTRRPRTSRRRPPSPTRTGCRRRPPNPRPRPGARTP